ncbi:MAG: DMT family transporter [Candidatus Eiseniibacteriota bacterium]
MSDPASPGAERRASLGPWMAFAGAASIWGSTFLVISFGNDALAPVWAGTVRLALASVGLGLWARLARHPMPRGAALQATVLYGVFAFGFNFPLLYWGEKTVPSGLTAVVYATTPLSSALLARFLGMEQLTRAKLAGALVALAGVATLFSGSFTGAVAPAGLVSVFLAATCGASGATLLKRGGRQSAIAANAIACAIGAPIALAASFALRESHALPLTFAAIGPLIYLTVAGSMGAFVLFSWLVQRWPVSRSAYVSVVIPMIALSLGALLRHERLTLAMLGGSALVIAGLVIGMRGSPAGPPAARRS